MERLPGGWVVVARVRGVVVRAHWSLPLGLWLFGRFAWAPGAWLGFVAVVLAHEMGHAALVRRVGGHVEALDVHGLGGECRWSGDVTPIERAAVAWGGVLGQLALFAAAWTFWWFWRRTPAWAEDLLFTVTIENLALAALNLVPRAPLDGAEAWRLPGLLWERARARRGRRRRRSLH
jgi:membrane-associated protease RseP (regulator of RpoE activity)